MSAFLCRIKEECVLTGIVGVLSMFGVANFFFSSAGFDTCDWLQTSTHLPSTTFLMMGLIHRIRSY